MTKKQLENKLEKMLELLEECSSSFETVVHLTCKVPEGTQGVSDIRQEATDTNEKILKVLDEEYSKRDEEDLEDWSTLEPDTLDLFV